MAEKQPGKPGFFTPCPALFPCIGNGNSYRPFRLESAGFSMQPCRWVWLTKKPISRGNREMTEEQKKKMIGIAIAGAAVYVAWKYAPSQTMKAMALGVGGVIVGKQLPYIREALV